MYGMNDIGLFDTKLHVYTKGMIIHHLCKKKTIMISCMTHKYCLAKVKCMNDLKMNNF